MHNEYQILRLASLLCVGLDSGRHIIERFFEEDWCSRNDNNALPRHHELQRLATLAIAVFANDDFKIVFFAWLEVGNHGLMRELPFKRILGKNNLVKQVLGGPIFYRSQGWH